ncbi:MAG: hypothetical protein R3272_05160 [Candidatus Promineifilaceae bacterium]|nr:hypothetical protein [Candidatus Promineifilaceae bacterium]
MTSERHQDQMDRRNFLKGILITAVAASGIGGGAAALMKHAESAPATITPVSSAPTLSGPPAAVRAVASPSTDAPELVARLTAAQAENVRLQTELQTALGRLQALEQARGSTGEANEALEVENSNLKTELAALGNHLGLLTGLVALYEQLDALPLEDTVDSGLNNFSKSVGSLLNELPALDAGVSTGQQALDELEAHIPLLKDGRNWVESHLGRLGALYAAAERVLNGAVKTAGSFMQMLSEWFEDVLKWLPFGVGDTASGIMTALTEILDETPNTIHGLRRNVADPLDVWVAGEGDEVALRRKLIKPLKEQTLAQATTVATRARETETALQTELVEPVQVIARTRKLIRDEIAVYREQHQV